MTLEEQKRSITAEMLARCPQGLYVEFDPRAEGVIVPGEYRARPMLCLQIGGGVEVVDMCFTDLGITGGFYFSGSPYPCFIPWVSVYAVADRLKAQGVRWHSRPDAPAETAHVQTARVIHLMQRRTAKDRLACRARFARLEAAGKGAEEE